MAKRFRLPLSSKLVLPLIMGMCLLIISILLLLNNRVDQLISENSRDHAFEMAESFLLAIETDSSISNVRRIAFSLATFDSVEDLYVIDNINHTIIASNHNALVKKHIDAVYSGSEKEQLLKTMNTRNSEFTVSSSHSFLTFPLNSVNKKGTGIRHFTLVMHLQEKKIHHFFNNFKIEFILIFVVVVIVIFSSYLLIARRFIITPIINLSKTIQLSKNNKTPLTVEYEANDEIGELTTAYNELIENYYLVIENLTEAKEKSDLAVKAKSEFLSTMSHEIRTPMNGIIGMAQLFLKTPLNEKQQHYIDTILLSSTNLLSILNDILDLSKIDAGKIELEEIAYSPRELVKNTQHLFQPLISQKDLKINYEISAECPEYTLGDKNRVNQVLNNLMNNAIKFTLAGEIHIKLNYVASDEQPLLVFSVRDSGIGLSQQQKSNLFQPFSQADSSTTRKFGGTGLGLSISKRLITLMQGEIGVLSTEGKGSTFWFKIPFQEADPDSVTSLDKPLTDSSIVGSEKILLVDDSEINLEIAKTFLEEIGYHTDTVNNGLQAVESYQDNHYDLILMDCLMPEMDGYTATEKIRSLEKKADSDKHIAIIALTASATVEARQRCEHAGMDAVLCKPFIEEDLLKMVQLHLSPTLKSLH
ncbi:MAG: response regulator [Pseudomonadales bacterium]|nr:response regulator [Pseudomonadales bacterium]